jgi:hypothetical protein
MRKSRIEKKVEICETQNYFLFYPSSTYVLAWSQILLHFFLLYPSELPWSQLIK